jgi:putative ABC transport system permease protein
MIWHDGCSGTPTLLEENPMQLLRDCVLALRLLISRPGFSLLAIASLALGFGAAIAILTVADAVLVRELPYPDAARLVSIRAADATGHTMRVSELDLRDLAASAHGFSAVAYFGGGTDLIISGNHSRRGDIEAVSNGFFDVLGVAPAIGRGFGAFAAGADTHVAVISHALWRELQPSDGDLSKLGVEVSGERLQVIGVMPEGFGFPENTSVWMPRSLWPAETAESTRTAHNWTAIARLRADVDLHRAQTEAMAIGKRLKAQYGDKTDTAGFSVTPLRDELVGRVSNALLALAAGAAFLLLIAGVNVTNLFLTLALARRKEFAVRSALGAQRARLLRQSIIESALLTAIAFGLGLLFAAACLNVLVGLAGASLPRADEIGLDARVIGAIAALAAGFAVLLGVLPQWRRGAGADALAAQGRATTLGHHGVRLRAGLLVAQTALTVLLLIGSGLLGRSFLQLLRVDPGFEPHGAVAVDISMQRPAGKYAAAEDGAAADRRVAARYAELMRRFAALPGVAAVGAVNALPFSNSGADGAFWDGNTVTSIDDLKSRPKPLGYGEFRVASAGYLAAMGIPLVRGRAFDERDAADAPQVALVSATLARTVWPDRDPIGQKLQYGNMDGDLHPLTVVGIVGDVHDYGVDHDVRGTVYVNLAQRPAAASNASIVVRGALAPAALVAELRAELARSEPDLPVSLRTLDSMYASSLDNRRFSLTLFGLFAAVALGLALSGIYGLIAYAVNERRAEFALRMALGSSPARVLRFVLGQGLRLSLLGLALGCAAAFAASRLMQSLLWGVDAIDAPTYLGTAVLLLVASLLACAAPAWRAAKVDPHAYLAWSSG